MRGLRLAGLALAVVALGAGCGSKQTAVRHAPKDQATKTCQNALAQYEILRRDLDPVLANPSDSTADRRLDNDAERLKPTLAALIPAADVDQQAALSVYRSELRDLQTALHAALAGDISTAQSLLSGVSGRLVGLPTLIHALCKA
ncbi:MAG: hypothetical protein ACJ764_07690 [Solirubrobacteraceae bacterium]